MVEPLIGLHCGHAMHRTCLSKVLWESQGQSECPLCRCPFAIDSRGVVISLDEIVKSQMEVETVEEDLQIPKITQQLQRQATTDAEDTICLEDLEMGDPGEGLLEPQLPSLTS